MSDQYDEYWQEKELLNQVRGVGKGSRGGRGQRKRRHRGKIFTRRNSAREEMAKAGIVAEIVRTTAKAVDPDGLKRIEEIAADVFGTVRPDDMHVSRFWDAVTKSPQRAAVRNANELYLNAIIRAQAIYEWVAASSEIDWHIRKVQELSGKPMNAKFDLLREILRLTIDYNEEDDSEARKFVSRDALAIRWLKSQNQMSYQVKRYQADFGGGLHSWSLKDARLATKSKKKLVVDAAAAAIERDLSAKKAREVGYALEEEYEDVQGDKVTHWADMEPNPQTREQHRLQKLNGGGLWQNQMLLYFAREMKIRPEEAMVALVVGDPMSPLGVRHIATRRIGHVAMEYDILKEVLDRWIMKARRLLRPYSPVSWLEAAWRHDNPTPRRPSEQ